MNRARFISGAVVIASVALIYQSFWLVKIYGAHYVFVAGFFVIFQKQIKGVLPRSVFKFGILLSIFSLAIYTWVFRNDPELLSLGMAWYFTWVSVIAVISCSLGRRGGKMRKQFSNAHRLISMGCFAFFIFADLLISLSK